MLPSPAPPGYSGNAAFVVEDLFHLQRRQVHLLHHIGMNAGIDVAAARLHDRPLKRGHSHTGIYGESVPDGAEGYPPVEVNRDQVAGINRFVQPYGSTPGKVEV